MFYDDSPLSTILNVGMWGLSFLAGHNSGKNSAIKEMERRQIENELSVLRREIEYLKSKPKIPCSPPPIPPKE